MSASLLSEEAVIRYYRLPEVGRRMREYVGDACFIAEHSPDQELFCPFGPERLDELLARGGEVHRSFWDKKGLLVLLDLEYVNFDDPLLAYHQPERCFSVQQSVVDALTGLLDEYSIPRLQLLSGRGHHFAFSVARIDPVYQQLTALGRISASLSELYSRHHRPAGVSVEPADALAFSGLGMVLEYLGHRLLNRCSAHLVPVQLAAVEVVPGRRGREAVCLDLSAFGDPLHRRTARLPFSLNRKAEKWGFTQPLVSLPEVGLDLAGLLRLRQDLAACGQWAGQVETRIPQGGDGLMRLYRDYARSRLAQIHEEYYAESTQEKKYPLTSLDSLPACIRRPLCQPNDLLLKPAVLQNLVRMLLAKDWRLCEITRLVRHRLESEHDWKLGVHFHEASSRAEFYTRLFGGLVKVGRDRFEDFDCPSTRTKGYCQDQDCSINLAELAARWLRTHRYD